MKRRHSVRLRVAPVRGLLFILIFLSLGLPPAFAADPETSPAQPAAPPAATAPDDPSEHQSVAPNCRAEVKNLCKGIRPGGGRIKKCIQDNENKLSPACQKAVQERIEKGAKTQ